jgi:hypothetical protein
VTALELFFDLVVVFGVTQVTTLLVNNPTPEGLVPRFVGRLFAGRLEEADAVADRVLVIVGGRLRPSATETATRSQNARLAATSSSRGGFVQHQQLQVARGARANRTRWSCPSERCPTLHRAMSLRSERRSASSRESGSGYRAG